MAWNLNAGAMDPGDRGKFKLKLLGQMALGTFFLLIGCSLPVGVFIFGRGHPTIGDPLSDDIMFVCYLCLGDA